MNRTQQQGYSHVEVEPQPQASAARSSSSSRPSSRTGGLIVLVVALAVGMTILLLMLYLVFDIIVSHWVLVCIFVIALVLVIRQRRQQAEHAAYMELQTARILRQQDDERLVAQSAQLMLEMDRQHLIGFVEANPTPRYEDWIASLHPENATTNDNGEIILDHRFYVEDSDHRKLWNDSFGERGFVAARTIVTHQ